MKSVRQLITEKKRSDYGRKGGQGGTRSTSSTPFQRGEDRERIQDTSKYQTPGRGQRPTPLTADDIYQAARPVDANVDIGKAQTWIGSSKRIIKKAKSADAAERAAKGFGDIPTTSETGSGGKTASSSKPRGTTAKPGDLESFMRGEQGKGRAVSPTMQDVAGRKGAGYDFPQDAGTEKPRPTKPGSFVVDTTPPKGKSTGRIGNKKFSGDAKYREMLAKMDNAPAKKPRTRTVKQAEVSKEIAQKTADYKTVRGERAYRKTSADIEARRAFPTGKGGLKADEANPYVKREVRQARAAKLGGNVWDQPKGSSEPFKGQGKSPSKTTYPSFFKPTKPNVTASRISKTAAPDRSATKQAVQFLKNLRRKSSSTSTPKNATTHGVGPDGQYLSPEMRKAVHKNRNVSSVVVHQPPKEKKKTGGGMVRKPSADALQRAVAGGNKPRLSKSPTQSQQPQLTAKSVGSEVSKSISKAQNRGRVGAGGVLSALGAAQEYKVGAARAKREGKGKLGQAFRGAARAAGAFAGGVAGTAIGGKVAGSVGAIGGGALGYSKGADFGSRAAKVVEKSSAAKWLAKTAKKYVPGIA